MSDKALPALKFKSLGHAAALACSLEAAAPKVGNVHRGADFPDLTLYDFLLSGQLLGETLEQQAGRPLGEIILASIQATRQMVRSNSNLGIVLLFAPLAKCFREGALSACAVLDVLEASSARDAELIYQAIRCAQPGGMGTSAQHDVHTAAVPEHILHAMELSREQDLIARQYCTGLADVFDIGVPTLLSETKRYGSLIRGIVSTHLFLMGALGDSLVGRKCGREVELQMQMRAQQAFDRLVTSGWETGEAELADLDFWLRADGNRRNPGATADLIAASLLVALLSGQLQWLVP